jgi:hypothetical protein
LRQRQDSAAPCLPRRDPQRAGSLVHVVDHQFGDGPPPSLERTDEDLRLTNVPLNGSSTMASQLKEGKKRFKQPETRTGAKPSADAWTEIRFDH